MQVNWSIILNVLLLIGVIAAIARLLKPKRKHTTPISCQPSLGVAHSNEGEVIAIRKINSEPAKAENMPVIRPLEKEKTAEVESESQAASCMMFLLAKDEHPLAGYELLQTVLAAGLRFGEGQLFHRHQQANGQGPILCSLAAATKSGIFDLQNIGAFSAHGLCLFMHPSGHAAIDAERFSIMLETGKQLSEGLEAHLLDDRKQPLTEVSIQRYQRALGCELNG